MSMRIIPSKYVEELEKRTGIKMQFSQLAEISGATKQLINQYKDRELPSSYSERILHYFSKYDVDSTCYDIPIKGYVEASMGYGVTVYNEEVTSTYSISKKFADDLGINPKSSEIIYARGDSMEPTIIGGDCILIDLSKKSLIDGVIYCIRLDGQPLIKRLQRLSATSVGVVSDNPKYKMREIALDNNIDGFEIIGEVRWWGRIAK